MNCWVTNGSRRMTISFIITLLVLIQLIFYLKTERRKAVQKRPNTSVFLSFKNWENDPFNKYSQSFPPYQIGRDQGGEKSPHSCRPLVDQPEQLGVLPGRHQLQTVPKPPEQHTVPVLPVHLDLRHLVEYPHYCYQKGEHPYFQGPHVQPLPVSTQDFDLGHHAQVIDDPVDEVAGPRGDLHQSGDPLLPVENKLLDRVVLIDAFKESKDLPCLSESLCFSSRVHDRLP